MKQNDKNWNFLEEGKKPEHVKIKRDVKMFCTHD